MPPPKTVRLKWCSFCPFEKISRFGPRSAAATCGRAYSAGVPEPDPSRPDEKDGTVPAAAPPTSHPAPGHASAAPAGHIPSNPAKIGIPRPAPLAIATGIKRSGTGAPPPPHHGPARKDEFEREISQENNFIPDAFPWPQRIYAGPPGARPAGKIHESPQRNVRRNSPGQ
jgi:hypothetical protein